MLFRVSARSVLVRLVVFGLLMVLLASVLRYTLLARFLREDMTQIVEQEQMSLAQYVASDVDFKVLRRQTYLKSLAAGLTPESLAQESKLRDWIERTDAVQTLFSGGLQVYDAQARRLGKTGSGDASHTIALGAAAMESLRAGNSVVGRPTLDRVARAEVPVVTPLLNAQGKLYGLLAGITYVDDPAFLGGLVRNKMGRGSGGLLLVSPQDALFVAASQPEFMLRPTPRAGVNLLHDRAMQGYRGAGVTTNAAGVEEISAIASVPSTGWFVVARTPTSEAYIVVEHAKSFMLRGTLVAVLTFLTLFAAIVYLVLRPLIQATRLAEKMTLGDAPLRPLPVPADDEVGRLLMAFNRLLDKLNAQNHMLALAAHHDALTGLPNRTLLADRLAQALAQAARHRCGVGVLYLDLDKFKPINDSYGIGDRVLQEVAARLTRQVRGTDSVARLGGDEFIVLLSELPMPADAAVSQVASSIIETLSAPIPIGDITCRIGVSIGCAIGDGGASPEGLLLQADHLMYQAKAQGRGRYVMGHANAMQPGRTVPLT